VYAVTKAGAVSSRGVDRPLDVVVPIVLGPVEAGRPEKARLLRGIIRPEIELAQEGRISLAGARIAGPVAIPQPGELGTVRRFARALDQFVVIE
jgi:hypothetical protein